MKSLPVAGRLFVFTVITAGLALLAVFFPFHAFANPWLFLTLLTLSSVTSVFKVNLPLARSGSTMSVSYAVDFASLLLLGPNETMIVAAVSAWSQCTFRIKERNPLYRTMFSMCCLVITVQAAGLVYHLLGGSPGDLDPWTLPKPLVGAASAYFLVNTAMVATAIALSTHQRVHKVWNENFLWSAPSYFVGALVAAGAVGLASLSLKWMLPLAAAPLYATYRGYKVYLGRIDDEQRHVREMADLHLATIEALALAIDAKDQTSQSHIRRVQLYAAALARALGMTENHIQGVKTAALLHDIGKLAVPEHILSKPGPLTPEEFQKIRGAPAGRRRDHQRGAVPLPGVAADPQPPRALGRQGLPVRAQGRGDPARRADPLGRGLLRRADGGAPLPQGDGLRGAPSGSCSRRRARASTRRSWRSSSSCCRRCSSRRRRLEQAIRRAAAGASTAAAGAARPTGLLPEP